MILKVRKYGDPVLRKKAEPVVAITDEIKKIARDMIDTMIDENGLGLAAPQVGLSLRMLALDAGPERGHPFVIFNPEILESSGKSVREEGCLSFPGIYGKIERPEKVKLKATDIDCKVFETELDGLEARAVQHEIDHLNGKLFIDRMNKSHKLSLQGTLKKLMQATREELGL